MTVVKMRMVVPFRVVPFRKAKKTTVPEIWLSLKSGERLIFMWPFSETNAAAKRTIETQGNKYPESSRPERWSTRFDQPIVCRRSIASVSSTRALMRHQAARARRSNFDPPPWAFSIHFADLENEGSHRSAGLRCTTLLDTPPRGRGHPAGQPSEPIAWGVGRRLHLLAISLALAHSCYIGGIADLVAHSAPTIRRPSFFLRSFSLMCWTRP
jgi:hypothetical protein